MEDTQPRPITETLIDLDQVHSLLATGWGRGSAAGIRRRCLPAFLGQTLRLALAENHVEMAADELHFRNRILRDDATIVFDLYFDFIVRQHSVTELQDFRKPVRFQPVLRVLPDVGLEQDRFALSDHPAAIDEVLHDVADLG
jgi:hypothetical protein